ncbi:hypothetical protein [Salinispora tropica]|uniref:Uncharacterized protein n=1 Tax=Salinispora tropica (strain ATCC BAA-916 / DSM 44818 / JCM 13857 / NBRC 105044 / CNB-440) TaxID=369723 RepID=A4X2A0_SALTO|nr:hypothetical protein [Salinispora tropica]ABP53000.1 hypothetical protein Strop_0516 [Salinispora tropica CNB-440]
MIDADWSVLELEGVMPALSRAARNVARRYPGTDLDDLLQDAALMAATRADLVRGWVAHGQLHHLYTDVMRDLEDDVRTQAQRGERSLDAMLEGWRSGEGGVERELADGDGPPPRQRIRNGEYGGKMLGLRWAAPHGAAGGLVATNSPSANPKATSERIR